MENRMQTAINLMNLLKMPELFPNTIQLVKKSSQQCIITKPCNRIVQMTTLKLIDLIKLFTKIHC